MEPTLVNMLIDPVFMIREESANTIIKLSKTLFDATWLYRIIEAKLDELVRHERFMLRIQTIHMINQMKEHVSDHLAGAQFAQYLFTLATDPVPNIRFNVSKTLISIYPKMNEENKGRTREILERMAETDADFDAKYYAQKALDVLSGRSPAADENAASQ